MNLPPHFFVWLLLMVSDGQRSPVVGYRTAAACEQTAAELNRTTNGGVRFKCEKLPVEKL